MFTARIIAELAEAPALTRRKGSHPDNHAARLTCRVAVATGLAGANSQTLGTPHLASH